MRKEWPLLYRVMEHVPVGSLFKCFVCPSKPPASTSYPVLETMDVEARLLSDVG